MSSLSVHPEQTKTHGEWARLIPGERPSVGAVRREPQPAHVVENIFDTAEAKTGPQKNVLSLWAPGPLLGRVGSTWLRSMVRDFALVALNWLLVGGLATQLSRALPARWTGDISGTVSALLGIALLQAALITLMAYSEELHRGDLDLRGQTKILAKSVLGATAVLCLAYGLQGADWMASGLFCAAGVLHFGTLWASRWWEHQRKRAGTRGDVRNVLIVGAGRVGRRVASCVEQHPAAGRTVCGFLDDERPLGNGVIGRIADLARVARKGFVDEVILAAPRSTDLTRWVLDEARRLRLDVEIVPELFGCAPERVEIERVGGLPVISLHSERLPAAQLVLKRMVDVLGASAALALLSPVLALIAILIKLDSPGPVFYSAQRAGRKGRLFRCYKFRTMVNDADDLKVRLRKRNERSGPCFKIASDPRITRLGYFLRRYSLDELPQLMNVVKGEMSLVGPRPHPLDDVASYEIEHLARLDVTPGITGLWQVTARRDPSFRRGMELDREYIRNWSLALDVRILLRTFLEVACGSGE